MAAALTKQSRVYYYAMEMVVGKAGLKKHSCAGSAYMALHQLTLESGASALPGPTSARAWSKTWKQGADGYLSRTSSEPQQ